MAGWHWSKIEERGSEVELEGEEKEAVRNADVPRDRVQMLSAAADGGSAVSEGGWMGIS